MVVVKVNELLSHIGNTSLTSDWVQIGQDRINAFADVTEDHQFIHVDEEAAKSSPFGGTVAHGFLTLSMLSKLAMGTVYVLEGIQAGVNYGFNKVRFVSPVRAGKRVRGHFALVDHSQTRPGTHVLTYRVEVEIEGETKPALVAEWVTMQIVGV